jgi:hypothetical protein
MSAVERVDDQGAPTTLPHDFTQQGTAAASNGSNPRERSSTVEMTDKSDRGIDCDH